MIRDEVSIDIARPAHEVYAYLNDFSRTPEWFSQCVRLKQTSAGPKTAGSKLHYVYRQGGRENEMDGEMTACQPDQLLKMTFHDNSFEVRLEFRLSSNGEGTTLWHGCEIDPKGMMAKLMSPMIATVLGKQMAQDLGKLKSVLEG